MDRFFAPGIQVRNEATLITRNGDAIRPDRIVMTEAATYVLDIKTGRPNEKHHDQVRGYVNLLKELGMPAVSGHLLYVTTKELIPVDA
jgi:CRISPR/Cas system-associated exonuclease Cas4 (RecB family)